MKKIEVFHYTTPDNCKSIIYGGHEESGLIPARRLVSFGDLENIADQKIYDGVSHALLEAEPNSWMKNPKFPNAWKNLMEGIGLARRGQALENYALLKIHLTPLDTADVVDRKYLEPLLNMKADDITDELRQESWKQYWQSKVPLFEYNGNFEIPAVLIWNTITPDKIEVIDYAEIINVMSDKDLQELLDII